MSNREVLREVQLPPDPAGTIYGLSNAGYTVESAVADLVDNSVSAGATHVLIDLHETADGVRLSIEDNGCGMSTDRLLEAMRLSASPGSTRRDQTDLGRYGLGMKAAGLHLSRTGRMSIDTLPVNGEGGEAGWSIEEIKLHGWRVQLRASSRKIPGTTVCISDPVLPWGSTSSVVLASIAQHLGLVFGQLIGRGLKIHVQGTEIKGIDLCDRDLPDVRHLGPWSLEGGAVRVQMLILPPGSSYADGPLGRRAHSGLHLRRGRRAITWGGWFNLLPNKQIDSASDRVRLSIDIPVEAIDEWRIDLSKSRVQIPSHLLADFRSRVKDGLRRAGRERQLRLDAGQVRPAQTPGSPWIAGRIDREHPLVLAALTTSGVESVEAMLLALEDS
jgi:Histidine kinase-, DNA gyrase B-, and HSP90-like ATPase